MNITDFLFDSAYQIVTWVFIALAIGAIFLFLSRNNYRGILWGSVGLVCSITLMLGILADRHFFHGVSKKEIPETKNQEPRACIHVEPGPIKDFDISNRAGITIKIKNSGAATAYEVKSDVSVGILPYPFPTDYPFPEVAQKHQGVATLEPGAEGVGFGQFDSPLTKELITAVLDGTKLRLYLGGTVSYRLASGLQCKKRFLMSVGGPDFVASAEAYLKKGSSNLVWQYADRYNDVNKECE